MSERQTIEPRTVMLREESMRQRVIAYIGRLPLDLERPLRIVIDDPLPEKSRKQEEKYHAMIGDIAAVFTHAGRLWRAEDLKRILIDQFQRDTCKDPVIGPLWGAMGQLRTAPSMDGSGVVILNASSRKFSSRLAAVFIEWLYALGAELGVQWSDEPKQNS